MPSIKPIDVTLVDLNFLLDQMRVAIAILRYDSQGRPIYGYIDAAGVSHELGLFGDFNPQSVTDAVTGLFIYGGAREASGFCIPAGFFNHLADYVLELGRGERSVSVPPDRAQSGVGQAHPN
jgi:hypothetical protein